MKKRDWGLSVLTVSVCIYIIVMLTLAAVTSQIRINNAKQYPIHVKGYTPEDNQAAERERAWRAGDTLIIGPNGSLIIKPEGMEMPDFRAIVMQNQDSGFITMPGKVRNIDTSGND